MKKCTCFEPHNKTVGQRHKEMNEEDRNIKWGFYLRRLKHCNRAEQVEGNRGVYQGIGRCNNGLRQDTSQARMRNAKKNAWNIGSSRNDLTAWCNKAPYW